MHDLRDYERRFRRAGLPLFIEDYSAATDVFTRAAPLFALVFVAEALGAIKLDWPLVANVAAALGGFAILLGAFGMVNRLRGRAFWSLPEHVGLADLAAFVVVPAFLPLIFGGQVRSAAVTAAGNLLLLGVVYGVVGYGLPAILRGAAERLVSEIALAVTALTRAVPLLLLFAIVLFINTEMWQVFSGAPLGLLALIAVLLLAFGALFLLAQLPAEVRDLERGSSAVRPLSRRQRLNVALLMLVSHLLHVAVVSAATGAFFVAFGALAIGPDVVESWIGRPGDVLVAFDLVGERAEVTAELLRVSGAIAALSGLYYAIAVLTDATYRDQFIDRLTAEMRDVFEARREYLELRDERAREPAPA